MRLTPHHHPPGSFAGSRRTSSAQARWRAITGAHLVALVCAGARFENSVLVEREEATAA
ncbi:hypothetical protein [Streptomyces sp. NPDC051572]|uniref:hypothetical protein n=1 Tax=unclassified Streptomyces TaxID=2593676 RepID=UPI00344DE61A